MDKPTKSPLQEKAKHIAYKYLYKQFFCISLKHDIRFMNMLTYYIGGMLFLTVLVFAASAQALIVQAMGVPRSQQGKVIGDIAFWGEVAIIITSPIWGWLSDLIGRKIVVILGYFLIFLAIIFYPLGLLPFFRTFDAKMSWFLCWRVVLALGAAAVAACLTTILGDYSTPKHRGVASGTLGTLNAIGAVIAVTVFLRIPAILSTYVTRYLAIHLTFLLASVLLIVLVMINVVFLKDHDFNAPVPMSEEDGTGDAVGDLEEEAIIDPQLGSIHSTLSIQDPSTDDDMAGVPKPKYQSIPVRIVLRVWKVIKESILALKRDPRLIVPYVGGFVARADSIVITMFITLWVQQRMIEDGYPLEIGTQRGGLVSGIAQTVALLAAPIHGIIADRFNRLYSLLFASLISGLGYISTYFIPNVTKEWVYLSVFLIGFGEIGVIVNTQVLLTVYCPAEFLGSVAGLYSMVGAFGILFTSIIGGRLFDVSPAAPFIIIGLFNVVLSIVCAFVIAAEQGVALCRAWKRSYVALSTNV